VIEVRINDKGPYSFCIDTGMLTSGIDSSIKEYNYNAYNVMEINGMKIHGLKLHPCSVKTQQCYYLQDGVIGLDLFRLFTVELNYEKNKIVFYERGQNSSIKGTKLDLLDSKGHWFNIRAKINDKEGVFMVDTGAEVIINIALKFGDLINIKNLPPLFSERIGGPVASGNQDVYPIKKFQIDDEEFSDLMMSLEPKDWRKGADDGIIGYGIIRGFNWLFDFPGRQATIWKNSSYNINKSDLTYFYTGKMHYLKKELDEAEIKFSKSLEITPNLSLVAGALFQVLMDKKKHEEAIKVCEAFLKYHPNHIIFQIFLQQAKVKIR